MDRTPDYEKRLIDTSQEIMSRKDKVRNIIGSANWAEDGRYKEIILREILRSHLPERYGICTGFAICDDSVTSQLDIIIYDKQKVTNNAELLKQGDFVVVESKSVEAIIEVKSTFDKNVFTNDSKGQNAITKLLDNKRRIEIDKGDIFAGIFAFELGYKHIENNKHLLKYLASDIYINCISFDSRHFMRFWGARDNCVGENNYALYGFEKDLSFGYFISNLCEFLKIERGGGEFNESEVKKYYPINGNGKEGYRIATLNTNLIRRR